MQNWESKKKKKSWPLFSDFLSWSEKGKQTSFFLGLILLHVGIPLRVQWRYCNATVTGATKHTVAIEYHHSTLKGTPTCSNYMWYCIVWDLRSRSGGIWVCNYICRDVSKTMVVVVLRSPIHANEPSEYNGMLYRTSNRVLNNGIKVIILICMDGTSKYHHHQNNREFPCKGLASILEV